MKMLLADFLIYYEIRSFHTERQFGDGDLSEYG